MATRRIFIKWLLILVAYLSMIFGEGQIELVKMDKMGSTYVNHGYLTLITRSVIYCCAACRTDGQCKSVSYFGENQACQLNDRYPDVHQNVDVVATFGWDSYTANCSSPWLLYDGHCYLVVTEPLKWLDAESRCQSYNSHLVDIQDADEADFVVSSVLSRVETWGIFIGLYRDPDQELMYTSGDPVIYTNPASGEPSFVDSDNMPEDCFVINASQKINDISCSYVRVSVCKI